MGASLGGGGGPVADMNLTPLIDIVLVVLIIMMVNIPIQIEEMNIKVPGPKPENPPPPPVDPPEQLVIALYENGDIALNRKLMQEEKMLYEIGRRLRPMSPKRVFVDAHGKVPYGRVVDMVDLAREAGAATVGLARLKDDGPLTATSVDSGALPKGVIKGSVNCVGKLGETEADVVIDPLLGSITQCYNQALARNPKLSGTVRVRALVGPDGQFVEEDGIPAADGSSAPDLLPGADVKDPEFVECVEKVLPAMQFPPLGEGNTAICYYPLLLSPG